MEDAEARGTYDAVFEVGLLLLVPLYDGVQPS